MKKMGFSYKECMRNHAASLGVHTLDGCGEFMASPAANEADPSSLLCVACNCHRNFHRRYNPCNNDSNFLFSSPTSSPTHVASPAPRSFYASDPRMLYSFNTVRRTSDIDMNMEAIPKVAVKSAKAGKRARTKFTEEQKEKMRVLAEESDWMIRSCDEKTLDEFCREVGIKRDVLKVWFHNNKYRFRGCRVSDLNSFGGNNGSSDNVGARASGDGSSSS